MSHLLAEGGRERQHRRRLLELLEGTDGLVRIASAYVTDRDLLIGATNCEIRLVTSLLPMDIVSGATSPETLRALIESGVQCRVLPDRPRFHAKVYIFGTTSAVITSANLTGVALDSNIEVGVEMSGRDVRSLVAWYNRLWKIANPLLLSQLKDLQRKSEALRRDYERLKKKSTATLKLPSLKSSADQFQEDLRDLMKNAPRFFVCNSDRAEQKTRTSSGGYAQEEEMYNRGYAAAWEPLHYEKHMRKVQPKKDAIFMFASGGVGIIAIGRALASYKVLEPGHPQRISDHHKNSREWRVAVRWLAWRDDEGAYRWENPPPFFTFLDVSGEKYADFRKAVGQHFLND